LPFLLAFSVFPFHLALSILSCLFGLLGLNLSWLFNMLYLVWSV
jgi:hypothetical protein